MGEAGRRRFDGGHLDPRVGHDLAGSLEALFERRELVVVFEGIAGGHQQPDLVEAEALEATGSRRGDRHEPG